MIFYLILAYFGMSCQYWPLNGTSLARSDTEITLIYHVRNARQEVNIALKIALMPRLGVFFCI